MSSKLLRVSLFLIFFASESFAQTQLWREEFTDPNPPEFSTSDGAPTAWTTDYTGAGDFFTENRPFVGDVFTINNTDDDPDGEGVWTSESIDISGTGLAVIDMDVIAFLTDGNDYFRAYYDVGGGEVLFYEQTGDIISLDQTGTGVVSGSSMQIIIRATTDGNAFGGFDRYNFDNVTVTEVITLYSRANGNWDDNSGTGPWSTVGFGGAACSCIPNQYTQVLINGNTISINAAGSEAAEIEVQSTGILQWTSTDQLIPGGSFAVNSGGTVTGISGAEIIYNDSKSYTITNDGSMTLGQIRFEDASFLTTEGSNTISIIDDIQFDDDDATLTNNGTLSITGNIQVVDGAATGFFGGATADTDNTFNNNGTVTVDVIDGRLVDNGGAGIGDLFINNSGTINQTGTFSNFDTGSLFTNQDGGTWNYSGATFDADIQLSADNGTNTFNYNNAGNQNIIIPTDAYSNLITSGGSGTKTATATITVNGALTVSAGTSLSTTTFTLNGGGSIASTGSVSISTAGNFDGAVLDNTSGGAITFNDATSSSTSSGYITGPVVYVDGGTGNFEFPIGNGSIWARLAISGLTSGSQFTADYTYSNPQSAYGSAINTTDFPNPAATISSTEYWNLNWNGGGTESAIVTLYWEDVINRTIIDENDLTVARWDGSEWRTSGPNSTPSGASLPSSGQITADDPFVSFSPFTFASPNGTNPLPIELIFFDARFNQQKVDLSWSTAIEINNDYFTVERSLDGEEFYSILELDGAGDSDKELAYFAEDPFPFPGINYYRLKQTDFDGTFTYSDIVNVFVSDDGETVMSFYPNPTVNKSFTIQSKGLATNEDTQIMIRDVNGRLSFSEVQRTTSRGSLSHSVSLPANTTPGVYFVTLQSSKTTLTKKIIVK